MTCLQYFLSDKWTVPKEDITGKKWMSLEEEKENGGTDWENEQKNEG